MERLEQELRVVRQRFGDGVQNVWKSIHMVCIQKNCPDILRDHFAVHASSIDSLGKQRMTIEKFLQANVHGSRSTPMDVDALCQDQGRQERKQGRRQGWQVEEVDGHCFWCGAYGHMMEDCQKKAAGKLQVLKSPRGRDLKSKGNGKRWERQEGSVVP